MKSRYYFVEFLLLTAVMALAACGPAAPATSETTIFGEEIPSSKNNAEGPVAPALTPTQQFSPEATEVASPPNPGTPATASPDASSCQTPNASVKANNAYLREGPDLRFVTKAQYKNGDQFTVLGRYKDWFQVKHSDGNEGWLYKDWLAIPTQIDTGEICSVSEQGLELPESGMTPTPEKLAKPNPDEECVPTYYESCD